MLVKLVIKKTVGSMYLVTYPCFIGQNYWYHDHINLFHKGIAFALMALNYNHSLEEGG
jgi:hypothetical protein